MELNSYFEDSAVNGNVLDPSNQSFDQNLDLILSTNWSQIQNIKYKGTPFDKPVIKALVFVLYSAVFLLIFFGNLAVVLVNTLHWRMRKTSTFCLFHLAIANLCVGIFCVYQNLSLFIIESWIFGNLMCKMYFFIMSLSHTASILILVVVAIERYVVIVHPFKGRQLMTVGKLQIIITVVWILSGVICFHRFYSVSTSENPLPGGGVEVICSPNVLLHNHKAVDLANFLLLFLLPLLVISVLYTRVCLYLKRYSLSFKHVNVTPTIQRSPTEMEKVDRVLSNLTPVAKRRRFSTNRITSVAQQKLNAEIAGLRPRSITYFSRCCSSENQRPGSRAFQIRRLKRSQSWSHESTHWSGRDNGLPATSQICKVNPNDLLTLAVEFEESKKPQRLSSSDLVLSCRGSEDWEISGENRRSVPDGSHFSSDSDPSEMDSRTNNVEINRTRRSQQTRGMRNRAELIRLKFPRRQNNTPQCRNNHNSPRFPGFSTAQTLNELRQLNANHAAVIRMLVVIVITFALCNFPFHLRKMCQNYFAPCNLDHPLFDLATPATFLTMYANCAINPFIYAFMHRRFRICLVELLIRRCRRIKRRH